MLSRMCHACHMCLFQRFFHDLGAQAADLDVHLQGGDAFGGTGNFEIHVAEMIFGALDVGQNLVAAMPRR